MRNIVTICGILAIFCVARSSHSADSNEADAKAIRTLDQDYIRAFNAKNADDAARTFSNDAVYNTDDGKTLHGRDEIRRVLDQQFKDMGDSTLELKIYSIEVSPDKQKATERGVSVVTVEGIHEPSSYVAEFVKQDNQWLVSRVTEQAEAASTQHLRDLSWIIGDWTDRSADVSIRLKCEWGLDRAFIIRRFAATVPGRDLKGVESIGWDPIRKEFVSSYFDSAGGFGSGRWHRDGDHWVEETTGITPEGETASATHIYIRQDDNRFTWRSINRRVGTEKLDDLPEIEIVRTQAEDAQRGNL